jgi:hypothetical protein
VEETDWDRLEVETLRELSGIQFEGVGLSKRHHIIRVEGVNYGKRANSREDRLGGNGNEWGSIFGFLFIQI